LYYVSIKGITGAKSADPKIVKNAINNIKKNTNIPVAVGFGIKSPKDAAAIANTGCDGIVVGSALVEIIENSLRKKKSNHNIAQKVGSMVKSLKKKLS
jgi:tryptophan synthase alpha chain